MLPHINHCVSGLPQHSVPLVICSYCNSSSKAALLAAKVLKTRDYLKHVKLSRAVGDLMLLSWWLTRDVYVLHVMA